MGINEFQKWIDDKEEFKRKKALKASKKPDPEIPPTCKCNLGHIHRSREEGFWCNKVALRKTFGKIKDFKIEVYYELVLDGKKVGGYIVDFEIMNNDDTISIEEYKGPETEAFLLKRNLFLALYPEIPYKVIKRPDLRKC